MMKKILLMMKKNGMTLLGAAVLASGIFYVVNNPNFFTASVLSLSEKVFITQKGRDIAYKTDNGYVDIFMSEKLTTPASIAFTVSFDKDTVTIDPKNLSGQGLHIVKTLDNTDIIINLILKKNIDKSQSILLLPFTGTTTDILLSEAVAKFSDTTTKDLSIGSLNETNPHSSK